VSIGERRDVDDDRYQGSNVLDTGGLGVEVGDHQSIVVKNGLSGGSLESWASKKDLVLCDLASEIGRRSTLLLLNESRSSLTRLSDDTAERAAATVAMRVEYIADTFDEG
jgi:hypothetical protein